MEYVALALFALVMLAMVLPSRHGTQAVTSSPMGSPNPMPSTTPISPAAG